MNRHQLDALLAAGLISHTQYTHSLTTLRLGLATERPTLNLELPARNVALSVAADGAVTVAGDITEYDAVIPSHGMYIDAGALSPRSASLSDIKMLRDHDHAQPVGYMTSIDTANKHGEFRIAPTEAARVQQEFEDKLRDGLSIGFRINDYSFDENDILHVHQGEYHEVSLCALPAAVNARVTDVAAALATAKKENITMNRAQLAAALAAGSITQEQHDASLTSLTIIEASITPPAVPPVPTTENSQPEVTVTPTASPQLQVHDRAESLRMVTERISAAANLGDMAGFLLALTDVVPAGDAGTAFLNRDDWLGQLFTAVATDRPWIDAISVPPLPLTTLTAKGWRWGSKPSPASYAGSKAAIPSGAVTTTSQTYTAKRWAGGWDVDRAFMDFADPEYTNSFFEAAMSQYKFNSNAGVRADLIAAAVAGADIAAGGILQVLKSLYRDVRAIRGGKLNRIFLGDTLFDAFASLSSQTLPIWLKQALVDVDLAAGGANVTGTVIQVDPTIDDQTAYGFDSRAVVIREKSPIEISAVNIPNGGIDLGFFSYTRLEVQDPRLIVSRLYTGTDD